MNPSSTTHSENDSSSIEAIALQQLNDLLQSTLNRLVSPSTQLNLLVLPTQFKPLGLGQWVAVGQSPTSLIQGLRVLATMTITITSDSSNQLDQTIAKIQTALLGSDRMELMKQGVANIELINSQQNKQTLPEVSSTEQSLQFRIVYEALIEQSTSEGVIRQVSIQVIEQ
jgi:hypothetical protein